MNNTSKKEALEWAIQQAENEIKNRKVGIDYTWEYRQYIENFKEILMEMK